MYVSFCNDFFLGVYWFGFTYHLFILFILNERDTPDLKKNAVLIHTATVFVESFILLLIS